MPFYRGYRRTTRSGYRSRRRFGGSSRSTYRRRRVFRRRRANPTRGIGYPRNRVIKMRYIQRLELDPGASTAFVANLFSANSIFDPDATGAGHQPMGHDQWANFYQGYCVLGSKISIIGLNATSSVPIIFGVKLLRTTSSGHTDITGLMEDPTVSWRFMQTAVNGNVPRPAIAKYSARKFYNTPSPASNSNLLAAMSGNPATQAYYFVFMGAHDQTTDVPKLSMVVKITYIVQLTEPVELSQS